MKVDLKTRLLNALKKAETHISGEKLSQELGVSRAAVWKQVEELRRQGYVIDAVPHRGYLLRKTPDLLLPGEIKEKLQTSFCGKKIYYYPSIDSTNRVADVLGAEGEEEGTLVVAEEQTKGRGRRGREWYSPAGPGLWMSLLFYPRALMPKEVAPFTAAAAVAAARSLREETGLPAVIKWPNDLFINGRKAGGLLAEIKGNEEEVHHLVLGVGLNVNHRESDFPEELKDTATSLRREKERVFHRVMLCCSLLQHLEDCYLLFLDKGFHPFRTPWKELSITPGKRVRVERGSEQLEGIARDIDEQGALLLEDKSGKVHRVTGGEITSQEGIFNENQKGE